MNIKIYLLEKALEEQRIKEEEEKKRREEEEKIRIEQEKIRKIEEEKMAKEERQRLQEESNSDYQIWKESWQQARITNDKRNNDQNDWEKWTLCSVDPDPTNESDITAFISEYIKNKQIQNQDDTETLEQIQKAEEVIHRIMIFYYQLSSQHDQSQRNVLLDYVKNIRKITFQKLDEITSYLAKNCDFMLEEIEKQQAQQQTDQVQNPMKYGKQEEQKNIITKSFTNFNNIKYGIWINPNQKGALRRKPVEYFNMGVSCDVPRPFMQSSLIMKATWIANDVFSQIGFLQKDMVIGGVVDIECFEFLKLPKNQGNWALKRDFEVKESLKKLNYPQSESQSQNITPVKVYYVLPSYIFIHEKDKPRIALYDKQQGWITEYIDELKFDIEKRQLTFSTSKLAPLAYIQERCIDYPYNQFKLRCLDDETAILDILGKRQNYRFTIGNGWVRLDTPGSEMYNQQLSPSLMIQQLLRCGINLYPQDQDAEFANIPLKNQAAEEFAIENISILARGFYIKSSKWSYKLPADRVLVRIHDNPEYDEEFFEDQEKDWKSVCIWQNKCANIRARDSAEELDEKYVQNTVTHSNIEILFSKHELALPELIARVQDNSQINLVDTIKKFLQLTRIISFTTEQH